MTSTNAIHADDHLALGLPDVAAPVRPSTTFEYPPNAEPPLDPEGLWYSRIGHTNASRCEQVFEKLLGNRSLVFANGLAAFNAALTSINPKRVLSVNPCYHGCHGILKILERNYKVELLEETDAERLLPGDLVHIETPVNPFGEARNIAEYAALAHQRGALLLVDATFAPPPISDPFKFGADIVMHSATKYFGGHSDLLGGVLAFAHQEHYEQTKKDRLLLGTILNPQESWLLLRSLRSYELRLQRQVSNALKVVGYLESNLQKLSLLKSVRHSSLQAEPWVKDQISGGSPTFAILCTSRCAAKQVANSVKLFHHCTSLGGIESTLEWRLLSDETTPPELIRISVGGENVEDIIEDLRRALE